MSCSSTLFSLGIFSDVQYANRENQGNCRFRESLGLLEEAIECFNARDLEAVINLGDLVDSNEPAHVEAVMEVLEGCNHPLIHVLGNHDLLGPMTRHDMQSRLGITCSWGERIKRENWRVVVIDSTEVSMAAGNTHQTRAKQEIHRLRQRGDPCAENWNGMAGDEQMVELKRLLGDASRCGHHLLILNHMVVGINSGSLLHRCWNHQQLSQIINSSPCVVAHFNGHDHDGGFATDPLSGVHYLTFPALCDSEEGIGAHAIAHFETNSIRLEGLGRVNSRKMEILG